MTADSRTIVAAVVEVLDRVKRNGCIEETVNRYQFAADRLRYSVE